MKKPTIKVQNQQAIIKADLSSIKSLTQQENSRISEIDSLVDTEAIRMHDFWGTRDSFRFFET